MRQIPLLEVGHGPHHEAVEERDREREFTVGRAVDHALLDQAGAVRSQAHSLHPECRSNVTDAVGACAQTGHGSQESLFGGRQSVETHSEKVLV